MEVQAGAREPLINARDAAELLGCNERTVKRLADEKKIPAMRIGNRWRFLASMLEAWNAGAKPELLQYVEPRPPEPRRYVYVIAAGPFVKIGIADNVERRMASIQTGCPYPCNIIHSALVMAAIASGVEGDLHQQFSHKRTSGEWFRLTKRELKAVIRSINRKAVGVHQ